MDKENNEEINEQANETAEQPQNKGFEVNLDAFSGPLDLLCHLVDLRQMDPLKLNLTELVAQYVEFLMKTERTSLNEIAEFFTFASRLLLRKVHSLLPGQQREEESADDYEDLQEDDELTEEQLREMLENFRPYRAAAARFASMQRERENYFVRIVDEDNTPFYDLGDLYGLAARWWSLLQEYEERHSGGSEEEMFYDDIPDAVPDENAVDDRMEELKQTLVKGENIKLRTLFREHSKLSLIVTLLALLEMSRLGMVHIIQNDTFGDVEIVAA